MQKCDFFIFSSYGFDASTGTVSLKYSFDDQVHFEEKITFPINRQPVTSSEQLDAALFALHLICGISYYKAFLPENIEVRSGKLNKDQADYWNTVYTKGLGEFFYKNDIDFRDMIHFPVTSNRQSATHNVQRSNVLTGKRTLVPFGGGKDSFVTAMMLKEQGKDVTLLRVGSHPLIDASVNATKLPCLTIDRKIAPELIALNKEGALNGHIPITAIVSWISVVAALLYDFNEVAMSNEKSANVGNTMLHGMEVNHQWSKGLEYEHMMAAYVKHYIDPSIRYYSALRELTELQIAGKFCAMPEYLPLAVSCNKNWSITKEPATSNQQPIWCCSCPKCAFVFLLYAAFLPKQTVIDIFRKNLFDDAALLQTYRELLGIAGVKPFECVGTPEETREAFERIRKSEEWNNNLTLQMYNKEIG